MAKFVIYNGGTESYCGCTGDPTNLVVGRRYEVVSENVGRCQTDYTLKGFRGEFNSVWFDEEIGESKSPYPATFVAVSHAMPIVGQRLECSKMEYTNGYWRFNSCITSALYRKSHSLVKTLMLLKHVTVYML